MDQKKIGKFIAQLRKEQGYTQSQLAEKLNISNKTVSKWETGNGLPDVSLLTPLCEALNITSDELFLGEKNSEAEPIISVPEKNSEAEPVISAPEKNKISKRDIIIIIIAGTLVLALCLLATCKAIEDSNKKTVNIPLPSAYVEENTPVTISTPEVTDAVIEATTEATVEATIEATPTQTPTATPVLTPIVTPTVQIIYVTPAPVKTQIVYVTPVATEEVTPSPSPTPTPTPDPTPTLSPTPVVTQKLIPNSLYGGYKFTSKEGRQSQYSYYYINCGMEDSPLGKYSNYSGTVRLSYKVHNPTDETIRVQLHVQANHNNFWCYMYPRTYTIVSIAPGTTKTVTADVPIENGSISFTGTGGVAKLNAEKAFLRFDVYFSDMEKAGNQVVIYANSEDDPILNCAWYSTNHMIAERIY